MWWTYWFVLPNRREALELIWVARPQTVLLAKEVYPIITGNVHVQTSPAAAYNTEETVKHAKTLVALFNDQGIPK